MMAKALPGILPPPSRDEASDTLEERHVAEAVQYRQLDRKF